MKKRIVRRIVVHCTARTPSYNIQPILDYWRSLGWQSNGYARLVKISGLIVRLQDDEIISNGVKGYNSDSIHITYDGGIYNKKPFDTRTPEQKESLLFLVEEYVRKYHETLIDICGHRDLSPDLNKNGIIEPHEWIKVCPCFDVRKEYIHLLKKPELLPGPFAK